MIAASGRRICWRCSRLTEQMSLAHISVPQRKRKPLKEYPLHVLPVVPRITRKGSRPGQLRPRGGAAAAAAARRAARNADLPDDLQDDEAEAGTREQGGKWGQRQEALAQNWREFMHGGSESLLCRRRQLACFTAMQSQWVQGHIQDLLQEGARVPRAGAGHERASSLPQRAF